MKGQNMIPNRPITSIEVTLESSTLHSWWYCKKNQTLRVKFKKKDSNVVSVYLYREVPLDVFEYLNNVDSKGMYFHSMIKNKYPTEKLADETLH